ncbi:DUF7594 domain-containing protein [Corallococcus coralloides]|uniref:CBM96 family carbohydrate-binding protein n=1 Tax=Corallococcus coralloides TaxID=184914 RepID=UPI003B436796
MFHGHTGCTSRGYILGGTPGLTNYAIASADARTNGSLEHTNYGDTTRLRADSSPAAESFLRFDFVGLGAPVNNAKLRLYATTGSKSAVAASARAERHLGPWGCPCRAPPRGVVSLDALWRPRPIAEHQCRAPSEPWIRARHCFLPALAPRASPSRPDSRGDNFPDTGGDLNF